VTTYIRKEKQPPNVRGGKEGKIEITWVREIRNIDVVKGSRIEPYNLQTNGN
jgi:hypothetical protein